MLEWSALYLLWDYMHVYIFMYSQRFKLIFSRFMVFLLLFTGVFGFVFYMGYWYLVSCIYATESTNFHI